MRGDSRSGLTKIDAQLPLEGAWLRRLPLVVAPLGLCLSGALVALGLPTCAPISSASRSLLGVSDRLTDRSHIALTLDDGPHAEGTPRVLDLLSGCGVKATFFLVGEQVARRPHLAAEIARRGHEIGLHGYRHRVVCRLSERELIEDLDKAAYLIAAASGRQASLYRPPRGIFTYQALRTIRRRGFCPVLWAADGRDWRRQATPASIAQRITSELKGGEVILLHDSDYYASPGSWRNALAALSLLIPYVQREGMTFVPLTMPPRSRRYLD